LHPTLIISDFDEVIVRCDLKWFSKIKAKSKEFGLDYDDPRFQETAINLRPTYCINEFLQLPIDKMPLFDSLYYDDPNYYDDIPLTPVGKVLKHFSETKSFQLVIISVSKGGSSTPVAKSKLRFIENNFDMKRTTVHLVEADKSEIIRTKYPDWDVFYEDNITKINDVLRKTDLNHKKREVLVPAFGWNVNSAETNKLIEDTDISLMYYYRDLPSIEIPQNAEKA